MVAERQSCDTHDTIGQAVERRQVAYRRYRRVHVWMPSQPQQLVRCARRTKNQLTALKPHHSPAPPRPYSPLVPWSCAHSVHKPSPRAVPRSYTRAAQHCNTPQSRCHVAFSNNGKSTPCPVASPQTSAAHSSLPVRVLLPTPVMLRQYTRTPVPPKSARPAAPSSRRRS